MDLAVVLSLKWRRKHRSPLGLDTSEVRGFLLATALAMRPPLTQLGNTTKKEIILTNPGSKTLLVHGVPHPQFGLPKCSK